MKLKINQLLDAYFKDSDCMSEESNEHIDVLEIESETGEDFFVLIHEKEREETIYRAFHAFDSKEDADAWLDKMGFDILT